MEPKLSEGQWRVGTNFNPSGNELVDRVKNKTAELIDLMLECQSQALVDGAARLYAVAATEYESAAMWAVKAITKQSR